MGRFERSPIDGFALAATALTVLFVSRFFLLTSAAFVTPEECHTGGIAAEVLKHGLRFPLWAYTPENYENGIVIGGLLATPLYGLFGEDVFALKLFAFVISATGMLAGLALLRRLLAATGLESRHARFAAFVGYVMLLVAGPASFVHKSLDAIGDHNEGSALSLLLLVLTARRHERRTVRALVVLWLAAGFAVVWEKGTAVVVGLALLAEVHRAWRGRQAWSRLPVAIALFLVGYSPALLLVHRPLNAWAVVAQKFTGSGGFAPVGTLVDLFWLYGDRSAFWMGLFLVSLVGLFVAAFRERPRTGIAGVLALYTATHVVFLSATDPTEPPLDYCHYVFPMLAMGAAVLLAQAAEAASTSRWRTARIVFPLASVSLGGFLLLTSPTWSPDAGFPARLLNDHGRATCYWRFGRAFYHATDQLPEAVDMCRRLGDDHSLECISGLPFATDARPEQGTLKPREQRAFAFGWGSAASRDQHRAGCSAFAGADARVCRAGHHWDCVVYANLLSVLLEGRRLGRPHCSMAPPWQGFATATEGWIDEAPSPGNQNQEEASAYREVQASMSECDAVLDECYDDVAGTSPLASSGSL